VIQELSIKAVVFDLDGTIVNFKIDYKSIRAEIVQFLTWKGFPSSVFSLEDGIFDMLKKAEIRMRNNGEDPEKIGKLKDDALSLVDRYEIKAAQITDLMPGALETLKELAKKGLKIGIFTINSNNSVNNVLRCLGVKDFFEVVITRNSVPEVKPNAAHLEATLKALAVKPEEAVVVGDSILDMKCARGLDVMAIGITTGISSPKELTLAGADYLIPSLSNLLPLIDKINKHKC
jgi:HAD superfamily hydrolase (TIGR01549 family)